ncbi:MAG: hypothetical protein OJI67_01570, partial [Prosthecobacter sp.]|nr:hypothetical protein [Prosthecobacter sp.]
MNAVNFGCSFKASLGGWSIMAIHGKCPMGQAIFQNTRYQRFSSLHKRWKLSQAHLYRLPKRLSKIGLYFSEK